MRTIRIGWLLFITVLKRRLQYRGDLVLQGLDEIMRGARCRAGVTQASCHQLRHTCFTRLREAGMSIEALQAQAGHASIETTRVYLHLTNEWLAGEYLKASKRIDADQLAVAK